MRYTISNPDPKSGFFYVQDERYIASEHMDVRRDCVNFARGVIRRTVMFRTNGTPRAHGRGETGNRSRGWPGPCAGAASFWLAQHRVKNGMPRAQGGGESGDRSKGHDLLFSADYADYADYTDYCMRLAWALRTTAGMQEVEHQE